MTMASILLEARVASMHVIQAVIDSLLFARRLEAGNCFEMNAIILTIFHYSSYQSRLWTKKIAERLTNNLNG